MGYASEGMPTKLEYGSFLAASLAYLMAMHHDAAGLVTFDGGVRDRVPPRQGPGNLRAIMETLDRAKPGGETGLGDDLPPDRPDHQAPGRRHRDLGPLRRARRRPRRAQAPAAHEARGHRPADARPDRVDLPVRRRHAASRISKPAARSSATRGAFRRAYLDELMKFLDAIRARLPGAPDRLRPGRHPHAVRRLPRHLPGPSAVLEPAEKTPGTSSPGASMFTFLSPIFLLGTLSAAIPLLIHLSRSRRTEDDASSRRRGSSPTSSCARTA